MELSFALSNEDSEFVSSLIGMSDSEGSAVVATSLSDGSSDLATATSAEFSVAIG
jgi:hypothetical protein